MCKTVRSIFLAAAFLGAAGFLMAQSVPNNFIELDGNSADPAAGLPDDWNTLNGTGTCVGTGCQPGAAGGSLARSFIAGDASIAIFTTGASKDPIDVTQWKWKNGGTPDKDAITNGYAAAYQDPNNGHLILAFGADRFTTNGDANIGLWFFQQDVHPVGATSGGFSGAHTPNDIFIVSSFTQGGGVSTVTAYLWDPTCSKGVQKPGVGDCAESNLRLKFAGTVNPNCTNVAEGCAIVNSSPTDVSWPYLSKFGNGSTTIPTGGLYEGGLDVSALIGGGLECFTSFLIETRSSQTPSAVLKDFVAGHFDICGLSATKACPADGVLNPGGADIHYLFNGTAVNTGIGTLSNVTVYETLPTGSSNVVFKKGTTFPASTTVSAGSCPVGAPAGTTCYNLGSIAPAATEYWSVEFDSTSGSVVNNATVAASSTGGSPGLCPSGGTVCSDPKQATCSASPSNSITISKACAVPADPAGYPNAPLPGTQLVTQSGLAAVRVNFSSIITNTGQTTLTGVTLTDSPTASLTVAWPGTPGTIGPGVAVKYSGTYLPSGVTAGDLGGAVGRYAFGDEIKVTGATAALGQSPGADGTCLTTFSTGAQACAVASCNICPTGSTCGGN